MNNSNEERGNPMVDYEVADRTAVITINRPEARNAVNGDVAQGIEAAVDRLEDDPDVWAAVLTGAGPVFCAGADLTLFASGQDRLMITKRGGFGGLVRRPRSKPLIAAVEGAALAGGCELALACDLIVSSRAARFGLPEVKRSLVASAGGLVKLPRLLPRRVALQMILTGEPIGAERAYELGLVNELCEPGLAVATATALADRINANAPLAVRHSRRIAVASADTDPDDVWHQGFDASNALRSTEDFREGPRAFLEKREPRWTGR
jgi:enoyl-CoA hydratase